MNKLFMALAILFTSTAFSQTVLTGIELIDTNAVFRVTQATVLGVDKESSPHRILYSFVHPDGAIQQVRGSLMSGGKDPVNIPAFGALELGNKLDIATHKLQWYCPDRVGTSVNFYAHPLVTAKNHMGNNAIAKKGNIMGDHEFNQLVRSLTPSSSFYQFEEKEEVVATEPTYVDRYIATKIYVGMSGKISYLTTSTYTLKPVEERNKGLFGTVYKMEASTNKEHTKTAFGDDQSISYKPMAQLPQVKDPVSGHTMIFGGIRYKKNKAKDNSHFYEFMLLTFNNDGEVVNRVTHESEEPLELEEVYPIYGNQLAPDVIEATHGIFVAQGGGNKKTPNINRKLRRVFVVDILTGEIIKQDEVEFKYGSSTLVQTRQLDGNRIALTYYYTYKGTGGIVVMTVGLDGIESVKEIDGQSPEFKAIGLADRLYSGLKLERLMTFDAGDGGIVTLEHFITRQGSPAEGYTINSYGYTFMKYDASGNLIGLNGIGNLIKKHNRDFISVTDGEIRMIAYLKAGQNAIKMKILNLNIADFTIETTMTPDGEYLVDFGACYYDKASSMLYFFTQKQKGKGISIFEYKL